MTQQACVSHRDAMIVMLRADKAFAAEYLRQALEDMNNPDERRLGLMALRHVAEAYGGMAHVAREAGISREALYRSLSDKGNPTLKTLLAVLHAVDMRLSAAAVG